MQFTRNLMRVPYTVGRWVRGEQHYGRQRLLNLLLTAPDNEYWVVGTRRMGKSSLLRQLEMMTDSHDHYVPLLCDLQGCQTTQDLATELVFAIEDASQRFAQLGITPETLRDLGAIEILRTLQRAAADQGKQLLLLIDEAEALIHVAEQEGNWLARLRRVFQDHRQRTVITATKMLLRLNDMQSDWMTSPFLFGFILVNLWSLDDAAAVALVQQSQAAFPVQVEPEILAEILYYTNRHPYLMQYLCQRLYVSDGEHAWLRAVEEEDLIPDHLLTNFLAIDFNHLSVLERRILLMVNERQALSHLDLVGLLSNDAPTRIHTFAYGLYKLGYIRRDGDLWAISNEYLARWLRENSSELRQIISSQLDEPLLERMIVQGVNQERAYLDAEMRGLTRKLAELNAVHVGSSGGELAELQRKIAEVHRELDEANRQLQLLSSGSL